MNYFNNIKWTSVKEQNRIEQNTLFAKNVGTDYQVV